MVDIHLSTPFVRTISVCLFVCLFVLVAFRFVSFRLVWFGLVWCVGVGVGVGVGVVVVVVVVVVVAAGGVVGRAHGAKKYLGKYTTSTSTSEIVMPGWWVEVTSNIPTL